MRKRISLLLCKRVDLELRNKVPIPNASTTTVAPNDINKAISRNEAIRKSNKHVFLSISQFMGILKSWPNS